MQDDAPKELDARCAASTWSVLQGISSLLLAAPTSIWIRYGELRGTGSVMVCLVGLDIFIYFWLRSYRLQVSNGRLAFNSFLWGRAEANLKDIRSVRYEADRADPRFTGPFVVSVMPKKEGCFDPIDINLKYFRLEDVQQFYKILEAWDIPTGGVPRIPKVMRGSKKGKRVVRWRRK